MRHLQLSKIIAIDTSVFDGIHDGYLSVACLREGCDQGSHPTSHIVNEAAIFLTAGYCEMSVADYSAGVTSEAGSALNLIEHAWTIFRNKDQFDKKFMDKQ